MNLREQFESSDLCKLMVGNHKEVNLLRYADTPKEPYRGQYMWSRLEAAWQGFQPGHAAGLEQQAKRIAELEAQLADAIEAQQILGLKLAHAEAQLADDPTDEMLDAAEALYYAPPENCSDDARGVRDLLTAIYKAMRGAHSASAVVGPTPGAAPACERNATYELFVAATNLQNHLLDMTAFEGDIPDEIYVPFADAIEALGESASTSDERMNKQDNHD